MGAESLREKLLTAGKPVFLWNLVDLERLKWDALDALRPGHIVEFDFGYDGLGPGTLAFNSSPASGSPASVKVDGHVVTKPKTFPMSLRWGESFDIGSDTLTGSATQTTSRVSLTAKLNKLTVDHHDRASAAVLHRLRADGEQKDEDRDAMRCEDCGKCQRDQRQVAGRRGCGRCLRRGIYKIAFLDKTGAPKPVCHRWASILRRAPFCAELLAEAGRRRFHRKMRQNLNQPKGIVLLLVILHAATFVDDISTELVEALLRHVSQCTYERRLDSLPFG